ncbi:response regulator [Patescibacteria group bacterium]
MAEDKKIRVLHADDEEDVLEVVRTLLESEGMEVESVTHGKKALERINEKEFDVILLDIMMPEMSGWDIFSRITKLRSDYKVAFLSVLEVSDKRLAELKAFGIKDYITKPFDADDLVQRVKKIAAT